MRGRRARPSRVSRMFLRMNTSRSVVRSVKSFARADSRTEPNRTEPPPPPRKDLETTRSSLPRDHLVLPRASSRRASPPRDLYASLAHLCLERIRPRSSRRRVHRRFGRGDFKRIRHSSPSRDRARRSRREFARECAADIPRASSEPTRASIATVDATPCADECVRMDWNAVKDSSAVADANVAR